MTIYPHQNPQTAILEKGRSYSPTNQHNSTRGDFSAVKMQKRCQSPLTPKILKNESDLPLMIDPVSNKTSSSPRKITLIEPLPPMCAIPFLQCSITIPELGRRSGTNESQLWFFEANQQIFFKWHLGKWPFPPARVEIMWTTYSTEQDDDGGCPSSHAHPYTFHIHKHTLRSLETECDTSDYYRLYREPRNTLTIDTTTHNS